MKWMQSVTNENIWKRVENDPMNTCIHMVTLLYYFKALLQTYAIKTPHE